MRFRALGIAICTFVGPVDDPESVPWNFSAYLFDASTNPRQPIRGSGKVCGRVS